MNKDNPVSQITEAERKIIERIRKLQYGKIVIVVEKNQPIRISEVSENIKL